MRWDDDDVPTGGQLGKNDPTEVGGYPVHGVLGDGGMGRVYLCSRPEDGSPVAVKVVRAEYAGDTAFRKRFQQEVETARLVQGKYTVPVLDADTRAEQPWLATAFVPGPSLQEAVERDGPQRPAAVLLLVSEVAEALRTIHAAGVVHRDLKPANVILSPSGPKVIDFGIARATEVTSITATGMVPGTPAYMAPEHLRGGEVTPAGDVFALGVLANFAATGRLAFGGGGDMSVPYRILQEPPDLTGCPEPLRAIVVRCLDKDPLRRPTPDEVVRLCAGAMMSSVSGSTEIVGATSRSRRRWLVAGAIAATIAVIAGVLLVDPLGLRSSESSGAQLGGTGGTPTSTSQAPIRCGGKQYLEGAGDSEQVLVIDKFEEAYGKRCDGAKVQYKNDLSKSGVKRFVEGDVDFAGSEYVLPAAELAQATARCQGNPPWHLPMVVKATAIIYHLDGVPGLVLNGEVAAKIFNGTIKTWNDPAIKALNGSANLPQLPIQVFHLSKGYRDNAIFQSYLKVASHGAWATEAGETFTGGTGTEMRTTVDLADKIRARSGSIGYDGWQEGDRGYSVARIDSGTGAVPLTRETAANAITADKIAGAGNDLVLNLDAVRSAPPAGAYPLVYVSYYVVCSKGYDAPTATALKAFLTVAATDAQGTLEGTWGVTLSPSLRARMLQAVGAIS
ncbi:serine/threonine-protein kinase [Actinocrispum sp. NPDC049592]|uniref:serine/threonine-protein kinase n=1 Tax=Actinocrispum sp. NPDC049592 TaxID=3154835 RepID=UPI003441FAD0